MRRRGGLAVSRAAGAAATWWATAEIYANQTWPRARAPRQATRVKTLVRAKSSEITLHASANRASTAPLGIGEGTAILELAG